MASGALGTKIFYSQEKIFAVTEVGTGEVYGINFDASWSSSVYKTNGKVRPLSYSTKYFIKAY